MSCEDVSRLLYDYVDEELDADLRQRVDAHLTDSGCECRRALLLEVAFNEKVKDCLCGGQAPDGLKKRIIESLSG